jgi:glycosyltransferase involved in cell wall biosynthesis
MFEISVHICTHNPRPDYLQRTLDGLKAQTLPVNRWELLLVDNASTTETAKNADLSWHPNARYILEPELGKTNALILALRSSKAAIMVTVDDDNILASDYLEKALEIGAKYPVLGAWGCEIEGEYEIEPPEWSRPYLSWLAIRPLLTDRWSNLGERSGCVPVGAGMCVRDFVAKAYVNYVENSPYARLLDHRGGLPGSFGDTHLAVFSLQFNMGTGVFKALKLTHLIPAKRLERSYIIKAAEGGAFGRSLFEGMQGRQPVPNKNEPVRRFIGRIKRLLFLKKFERQILEARLRGYHDASEVWYSLKLNKESIVAR